MVDKEPVILRKKFEQLKKHLKTSSQEDFPKFEKFVERFSINWAIRLNALRKCHDCGVSEGELHEIGCDQETCPICLHQVLSCGHGNKIWSNKSKIKRIPYV
jgi:hypothetical protein